MSMDRRVFLAGASAALALPTGLRAQAAPQSVREDQRFIESGRLSVLTDPWGSFDATYFGPNWREPLFLRTVGANGLYFDPVRQFLSAAQTGALAFEQVGAGWALSRFEVAGFAVELLQMVQDAPRGNYSELIQRYALLNLSGTRRPFNVVKYVDAWLWPSDDAGSVNYGLARQGGRELFAYSGLFKAAQPHIGLMLQGAGTPNGYAVADDQWAASNLPQDIPRARGLPANRLDRVHGDADGDGRTDPGQFMLTTGLALQRQFQMERNGWRQQLTVRVRFGNGTRGLL